MRNWHFLTLLSERGHTYVVSAPIGAAARRLQGLYIQVKRGTSRQVYMHSLAVWEKSCASRLIYTRAFPWHNLEMAQCTWSKVNYVMLTHVLLWHNLEMAQCTWSKVKYVMLTHVLLWHNLEMAQCTWSKVKYVTLTHALLWHNLEMAQCTWSKVNYVTLTHVLRWRNLEMAQCTWRMVHHTRALRWPCAFDGAISLQ